MAFLLTFIGVGIMVIALIIGLLFIAYLMAYAHQIFPFRNGYQEGEAEVVGFNAYYHGADSDFSLSGTYHSYHPVLKYYNAYQQKTIEKECFNSGILSPEYKRLSSKDRQRVAEVGTKVAIQYTKKAVRVADERFVSHKQYDLMHYVTPIIICLVCAMIGVIVLVIGIFLP